MKLKNLSKVVQEIGNKVKNLSKVVQEIGNEVKEPLLNSISCRWSLSTLHENIKKHVSMFSRGIEKDEWREMGYIVLALF